MACAKRCRVVMTDRVVITNRAGSVLWECVCVGLLQYSLVWEWVSDGLVCVVCDRLLGEVCGLWLVVGSSLLRWCVHGLWLVVDSTLLWWCVWECWCAGV